MGQPPRSRWRMFACATAGCSSCGPIRARRRSLSHRARTDGAAMASMFDAHDRAFAFFKGTCTRGIYDNMKTAVETISTGKERLCNRRFLQMASHYLVEPVACTPASGWEKGQVESQVGTVRQRFFSPRVRVKSYEELNAWLLDKCIASARSSKHPELTDKTVWEVFQE